MGRRSRHIPEPEDATGGADFQRHEVRPVSSGVVDAQLPELARLINALPETVRADDDTDHIKHLLGALDEVIIEAERIQRLAARAGADAGLTPRSMSALVGASHNTVIAWIQRSRIEFV